MSCHNKKWFFFLLRLRTFWEILLCIYQPLRTSRMQRKVNLQEEINRFKFSFTSGSVAVPRLKSPACPTYFTHSWKENSWIYTFPKDIVAMWNANSLVQDSNWASPWPLLTTIFITPRVTSLYLYGYQLTSIKRIE